MKGQTTGQDTSLVGGLLDGRYQIDAVLARGGMSTVFQGIDRRLDRPVAIKVMDPRFAADPAFLRRFEREARAAARLHHPGIVGVYDQGLDPSAGDHVFLVMELVEGGTLRDLLHEYGALPVPLALAVTDHVLAALAVAHQQNLVHRDVKPENVLIGVGGVVKVADFGLVRAAAESGSNTGDLILGTVAYLSPEQVQSGSADPRSDVYATGILLFEMLTGAPPYTGETALSVAYRHVNDNVPAPGTVTRAVPAAVDQLVVQATRRDPAARPADATALRFALQRVRTELGIDQMPIPVPTGPSARGDAGLPGGQHGPRGTRALDRGAPNPSPDADGGRSHDGVPHRERTHRRRTVVSWLVVVLLLATAVGAAGWWLGSGRWTTVPELTGMERATVQATLAESGLSGDITEVHHDSVPAGLVIGSEPGFGERALRGSDVVVLLSLGRPVVPDLPLGMSADEAERALDQAGLTPIRDPEAREFHDTVPEGTLVGTVPAAGTTLTVDAPVTVVISRGPEPISVPGVRGLSEAEAVAALTEAGLDAQVRRRFDDQTPGGQVIGTTPRDGTETLRGSAVTVLVSTALLVPDVVGQPREQAIATLREAGFEIREPGDGAGANGVGANGVGTGAVVTSVEPSAGSLVAPDDNVLTVRTSSEVTVPEVVGLSVQQAREVLTEAGLDTSVRQFRDDPSARVLFQSPGAGRAVEPGATVRVTAF